MSVFLSGELLRLRVSFWFCSFFLNTSNLRILITVPTGANEGGGVEESVDCVPKHSWYDPPLGSYEVDPVFASQY